MGVAARGSMIQIIQQVMALYISAVGESHDYIKAVIALERSNSFPWPKDRVQIYQTLFPPRGWGLGTRLSHLQNFGHSLTHSICPNGPIKVIVNIVVWSKGNKFGQWLVRL